MKNQKGVINPKTEFTHRKSKQKIINSYGSNNNISNNNNIDQYGFESYQDAEKTGINSPFEDIYLGRG